MPRSKLKQGTRADDLVAVAHGRNRDYRAAERAQIGHPLLCGPRENACLAGSIEASNDTPAVVDRTGPTVDATYRRRMKVHHPILLGPQVGVKAGDGWKWRESSARTNHLASIVHRRGTTDVLERAEIGHAVPFGPQECLAAVDEVIARVADHVAAIVHATWVGERPTESAEVNRRGLRQSAIRSEHYAAEKE
jgi:hypothetical protein